MDVGNQSRSGEAAEIAGTVVNGIDCDEALEQGRPYAIVVIDHTLVDPVTMGDDGTAWLLVSADSGFEGRTSVFDYEIGVTFTPIG